MKTRFFLLLLAAVLAVTPALADTWAGSVTAEDTAE